MTMENKHSLEKKKSTMFENKYYSNKFLTMLKNVYRKYRGIPSDRPLNCKYSTKTKEKKT